MDPEIKAAVIRDNDETPVELMLEVIKEEFQGPETRFFLMPLAEKVIKKLDLKALKVNKAEMMRYVMGVYDLLSYHQLLHRHWFFYDAIGDELIEIDENEIWEAKSAGYLAHPHYGHPIPDFTERLIVHYTPNMKDSLWHEDSMESN